VRRGSIPKEAARARFAAGVVAGVCRECAASHCLPRSESDGDVKAAKWQCAYPINPSFHLMFIRHGLFSSFALSIASSQASAGSSSVSESGRHHPLLLSLPASRLLCPAFCILYPASSTQHRESNRAKSCQIVLQMFFPRSGTEIGLPHRYPRLMALPACLHPVSSVRLMHPVSVSTIH
jgi:hypothetical protein